MGLDITGLGSIADFAGKILDKIFPDPTAAAQAKLALITAQQAGALKEIEMQYEADKAQIAVNAVEAASPSWFTSNWRPFIGWTCGVAFAYKFIVAPLLLFVFIASGNKMQAPVIDIAEMMPVLFGLLGLGALRTVEKIKGVA